MGDVVGVGYRGRGRGDGSVKISINITASSNFVEERHNAFRTLCSLATYKTSNEDIYILYTTPNSESGIAVSVRERAALVIAERESTP